MATIRVRDWTKRQIDRILEEESHSSHDSVIKSLLKDRELAQFAGQGVDGRDAAEESPRPPADKPFDDLRVLDEMQHADNGVLFLWCPNCGNELAHLTLENPVDLSIFEMECQRCLTHLDQHAIIAIEIGYPIEEKLVDDDLQDDLKACIIDYWDRTLEQHTEAAVDEELDVEQLVWQFDQYVRNFQWEWPADVPAVGFEGGPTYRNEATGELIEAIEPVTEHRNALDSFEVKRYPEGADPDDAETEIMDSNTIADLIIDRSLYLVETASLGTGNPSDRA